MDTFLTFEGARGELIKLGYQPIPGGGYGNGGKLASIAYINGRYQINHLKG